MNLSDTRIIEIFYHVDTFCQAYQDTIKSHIMGNPPKRKPRMATSEVITLMILFHLSGYRTIKGFYIGYVQVHLTHLFPRSVSYTRFTELMQAANLPLAVFLRTQCMGQATGISFIDSTPLPVCKNKRIFTHKVFKGLADRGKSTMGYFYGFKLHLVVNDKGELLSFQLTRGNADDRQPLRDPGFVRALQGKLYGDKGYISHELMDVLFQQGVHLVTQIRNNMKNSLMDPKDKIMLRKRSIIETIHDELKNMCQIQHSRHRSVGNFLSNLLAGLAAYSFFPKKPAIQYEPLFSNQLSLI